MALKVTKAKREPQAQVLKDKKVKQVLMVLTEPKVKRVLKVTKAKREPQAQVLKDKKVKQVLMVVTEPKVRKV